MPHPPKPETTEGHTAQAVDPATSCSPSDLLPWVIAELRAKHAEAEALMIDRDPQQKHALNEFNVFAFNNVPFLADRCEALMKANAEVSDGGPLTHESTETRTRRSMH